MFKIQPMDYFSFPAIFWKTLDKWGNIEQEFLAKFVMTFSHNFQDNLKR